MVEMESAFSDQLVGKEIEVTVTVEISDRDPHFGFAKRPAKLRVAS